MRDILYAAAAANKKRVEGKELEWAQITEKQFEALLTSDKGSKFPALGPLLKDYFRGIRIEVKNIQDEKWQNVMDHPELHNPVIERYLFQMTRRGVATVTDELFTKIMFMGDKMWVRDDVNSIVPFTDPTETVTLELDPSWGGWITFTGKQVVGFDWNISNSLEPFLKRKIDWFDAQNPTLRIRQGKGGRHSYTLKKRKRMTLSHWQTTFFPPIVSSMFVGNLVNEVSLFRNLQDVVFLNGEKFEYLRQNTEMPIHMSMPNISTATIVDGKKDEMFLHIAASRLNPGSSEFGTVFKVKFGTTYVSFHDISETYPMLFFYDQPPHEMDEYFGNFKATSQHIKNNVFQQACITYLERAWKAEVDIHVYKFTDEGDGTVDFMTHYRKSDRSL